MILIYTSAQFSSAPTPRGAWIYRGGLLVAQAYGPTEAEAVREAVRLFRAARRFNTP